MKKLLLILLCLPMIGFGQLTMIPDANFEQALISLGYDNNLNGSVYTAMIDAVTSLDVSSSYIADLTGIEGFISLDVLECNGNQLTSLDVSNNTALTELECGSNQLTSLNVSGATALTYLNCKFNQLTNLDVSNNTALTELRCYNNQLTSLNVSGATALTLLLCQSNQLTSLDLSNNTALTHLACGDHYSSSSGNLLTMLDVSSNISLTYLDCTGNQLTTLDVSNNTLLNFFLCYDNQLTSLDVSQNTALTELDCRSNQITSLDVSNNTALWRLACNNNQLTSLDVRNGNNTNMLFDATDNPNLGCINVDDWQWSYNNWLNVNGQSYFSDNCPPSATQEHSTNKELLKVTDLLGREAKQTNQPLFYIYDDGTVEKRIVIE